MATILALLSPVVVEACAVCVGTSTGDPFSRGINWAIMFMMVMPFIVAGVIGGWIFYMYRPWRRDRRCAQNLLLNPDMTQKESNH